MLRKSSLFVALAALFILPSLAKAQFQAGSWDLNLSGTGTSDKNLNGSTFAVGGQVGYLVTPELELGVRQGFNYAHIAHGPETYGGTTIGFVDYHFDMGAFEPFVGGNFGLAYGTHRTGTGAYGPEGGVKYFVNATTYVYGIISYEISTKNSSNSDFTYGIGLGVALK